MAQCECPGRLGWLDGLVSNRPRRLQRPRALSIVSAQTTLTKAAEDVSNEGASLINLQWATRPLPDASRERIRDLTREYTVTVIDEEWPAMERGTSSPRAQRQYDELRRALQDTVGGTKQEQVFARDSLVALREVGDARRARILAVSHGIPPYLWIGLLVSAVLAVLSAMNHPFGGGIHVEPEPLRLALQRFTVI